MIRNLWSSVRILIYRTWAISRAVVGLLVHMRQDLRPPKVCVGWGEGMSQEDFEIYGL